MVCVLNEWLSNNQLKLKFIYDFIWALNKYFPYNVCGWMNKTELNIIWIITLRESYMYPCSLFTIFSQFLKMFWWYIAQKAQIEFSERLFVLVGYFLRWVSEWGFNVYTSSNWLYYIYYTNGKQVSVSKKAPPQISFLNLNNYWTLLPNVEYLIFLRFWL